MSEFERIAGVGSKWQCGGNLSSHTLLQESADRSVHGYFALLKSVSGAEFLEGPALDFGSGAGHVARSFRRLGVDMVASEHTKEGMDLLRRENPELPVRELSIVAFHEPNRYALLVARELYPFTRVNAFSEQLACISRLIDSLRPRGVLLLIGSEAATPHCLDMDLLADTLRSDDRVSRLSGPWLEPLVVRASAWMKIGLMRHLLKLAIRPYLVWKRTTNWTDIRVLIVVRE